MNWRVSICWIMSLLEQQKEPALGFIKGWNGLEILSLRSPRGWTWAEGDTASDSGLPPVTPKNHPANLRKRCSGLALAHSIHIYNISVGDSRASSVKNYFSTGINKALTSTSGVKTSLIFILRLFRVPHLTWKKKKSKIGIICQKSLPVSTPQPNAQMSEALDMSQISRSRFPKFGTIEIWGENILCYGYCLVHHNITGLYPTDTGWVLQISHPWGWGVGKQPLV